MAQIPDVVPLEVITSGRANSIRDRTVPQFVDLIQHYSPPITPWNLMERAAT